MSRFRAFISYSHADARFAAMLQRDLENFRVPKETAAELKLADARLGPIFRDVSDLGAATTLSAALTDAIADSEAMVVVCSPDGAASRWVELEIQEFRRIHGERARVLPVIADSAGDGEPQDMFPPALGDSPPLAADARRSADGRRAALLKIVAGLLGTGLDELIRRDARRQQARLLAGISVTTTIAVVTAVLAVLAVAARQDAQRRLSQSEDLIGFMLGDLRQQLVPLGQVGVLQSVGDKALSYFRSLEDEDLTDSAMLRKSRALYQIGDVYFELGEFAAAQESFRLSLDQARRLAAAQPDNNERLFELAQAEFWTGYAAWYANDLPIAAEHLHAYHDAAWTLHRREPGNPDWIMETFWASNNLGSLAFRRGRFDEARENFRDAIARIDVLIEDDPTLDRLYERSTVYSWLGSTNYRLGDLDASRHAFLQALDVSLDPTNALHEEERAFQMGKLASVAVHRGEMQFARSYAEQAIRIAEELAESDSDSMAFLYGRTLQRLGLAQIEMYKGESVTYEPLMAAARRLLEKDDPPSTWRGLALAVADLGVRTGQAGAIEWAGELLDIQSPASTDQRGVERARLDLAVSVAQQDPDQAGRIDRILPGVAERFDDSGDFDLVLAMFRAYQLTGDGGETNRMRGILAAAGSGHPDYVPVERLRAQSPTSIGATTVRDGKSTPDAGRAGLKRREYQGNSGGG